MMHKIILFSFIVITALSFSCRKDNPIDGSKPPCGGIDLGIVPHPPYDSPIWHPSGQFIGFNHTPLQNIVYPDPCNPEQKFASDSTGFWLINSDGTNMRRIFPYTLQSPAWSPDGEWIAFVSNAQIFKMRFTVNTFDTTTLAQLTTGGENFYPAWSPDRQWIAYNSAICEGPKTCGIWMVSSINQQKQFLASYGNSPCWNFNSPNKILYATTAINLKGQVVGDSLWIFNINTNINSFFTFIGGQNNDSRCLHYSPDGTKIAFWSSGNLWIMDTTGNNQYQLTFHGADDAFSWMPSGDKIVYTRYQSTDWTMNNGVLWMIDINSKTETQFTFNR